jgi:hypothetical protein
MDELSMGTPAFHEWGGGIQIAGSPAS